MAEEKPIIHIDNDWKRQAQEEKQRLVDAEQAKAAQATAAATAGAAMPSALSAGVDVPAMGDQQGAEEAGNFIMLVRSLMAQTLYYLGDLAGRGGQALLDFDRAKVQLDTLHMLEEKTAGNLNDAEKRTLDTVLYDLRNRFVNRASQYL